MNNFIGNTNNRNIGICAHIDAGKTSLTERILFYSGKINKIGEVHDGNAVMDFMDQEKERGITIFSAVTTIYWSGFFNNLLNYKINIIDTPGHIDFTAEVERSLFILDGVCLVFCGVSGVQPQTEVIWNHINNNKLPVIGFINKMDRKGADYFLVANQINNILKIKPIILYFPYYENNNLVGVIDIVNLKLYEYTNFLGTKFIIKNINNLFYLKYREEIIEYLINDNDLYISKYIDNNLTSNDIIILIRKNTLLNKIIPLVCGSALKNKGVQLLLDSIINFLPSPSDSGINNIKLFKGTIDANKFSSLVFKVINDDYSGRLSLIRIYSGSLKLGDKYLNPRINVVDRVLGIIELHANSRINRAIAFVGDIVALIGNKTSITGDTLCSLDNIILFNSISFSEPVISVAINVNKSESEKLFSSIKHYMIEDPTITFYIDNKSNKAILSGMGELHLEVFLERIRRLTLIDFIIDKPLVKFKETIISNYYNIEGKYIKQSGGRGQYGHIVINALNINNNNNIIFVDLIKGGVIPKEYIKIINNSIIEYCHKGYLFNSPIVGIQFELISGSFHEVDSSENSFKLATYNALSNLFKQSCLRLLEPIMEVKILTPSEFQGIIISDVISRRGNIVEIIDKDKNILLISRIPMYELFNYSTVLRSKTKGKASFILLLYCYMLLPESLINKIIHEV